MKYNIIMDKSIPAFFGRIGSKKKIKTKIDRLFPDFKTYVEPFLGGGSIFFNHKFKDGQNAILGDKDKELMIGYGALKSANVKDIERFKDLTIPQLQKIAESAANTPIDKLVKHLIIANGTFGSIGRGKIYKRVNVYHKLKNIERYKEKLNNVKLMSGDAISMLKKFDGNNTFFFLDPPYSNSKGLYSNDSDTFNYVKLKDALKTLKGKFLLTINDTKDIRELFKGFKMFKYKDGGDGNDGIGVNKRNEIIIKNF